MRGRLTGMLDRLGRLGGVFRIPLALVGIAGIVSSARLRPAAACPAPRPGRSAPRSLPSRWPMPRAGQIGSLHVTYDRTLAENEDGTLAVEYRAAADRPGGWRAGVRGGVGLRLEASVDAARLTIVPAPARYRFSNARIARTGADRRVWTFAPQAEGAYRLLLRLAAEPEGFSVRRVAVNERSRTRGSSRISRSRSGSRPAICVSQAVVDAAKLGVGFLSFLLTLPAAAMLLQRFRGRPAPAPAGGKPATGKAKAPRRNRPPRR